MLFDLTALRHALQITGQGMGGIFAVMLLIMLLVMLLTKMMK